MLPQDVAKLRNTRSIILGKASLSEWAQFKSLIAPVGWSARAYQGKVKLWGHVSIICPASFNSVVGIKSTVSLTSRAWVIPVIPRQDTIGHTTRIVLDAVNVLDAIVGYDYNNQATRESSKYVRHGGYKQFL
ncbi:hypothetical protein ACFX13_003535 [Malus domestica]